MKYDRSLLTDIHGSAEGIEKNLYSSNPQKSHQKVYVDDHDLKYINRRFMGAGMSQSYAAIYWLEYYYEAHRFDYVVEVGSQKGSLSTYWANMAAITEAYYFDTFELYPDVCWFQREEEGVGHWFSKLAEISPYINVHFGDIFSQEVQQHVLENMEQSERTFLFCDGGDKIKEFATFAPHLKAGDRIAVHDWGLELAYGNIQGVCERHGLVPDEPYATSAARFKTTIMPFRKL